LEAFRQGRRVIIAPEGRESVSGTLEEGTEGAAFLALRAGVPVVPVTITGSEFRRIENNLKGFRRSLVTIVVGKPFILSQQSHPSNALHDGTRLIMETIARQLPPEYRGVYAYVEKLPETMLVELAQPDN
jgi:1-acyl-sn-glycerol-3-phosphate acyltransferase